MSESQYTAEVGRKFHPDGSVRTFPGNTVICFVPPESHTYRLCVALQERLAALPFGHKFSLLPPSSLHMTVFELLCDQVRTPEKWSSRLPLDAPLEMADAFFLETVPPVPAFASVPMRHKQVGAYGGFAVDVQPADPAAEAIIRGYRDALAQATGVRAPDHERYQFHISLAYRILHLDAAEEAALAHFLAESDVYVADHFGVFESGPPQLTFFDDMFAFLPAQERGRLTSRAR